jgi:hypothetical protein
MTRRLLPLALPVLLAGVLVTCPRPAVGCAVLPPKDGSTTISSESALVVYDSATKTEHFIRTASFQSTSAEFGFMVPTPTKPELAVASAEVFGELGRITERRTVVQYRAKALNFGCLLPEAKFAMVGSATPGGADHAKAVRVVEQKRVGDYDATVLQAADPKSLRDWLTANGYDSRPALDPWFEAYTKGKWHITAFKIAADSPAAGGNTLALTSSAVRISFPTDRPFYPYREPADMRAVTGARQLKLFVLSDERVSGTIGSGGTAWAAKTEWSNKVPAERMTAVAEKGKLPASVGTSEWHLTEFTDPSSPRPGTDELYLSKSDDQSAVERPPLVVWEEYDPWPWVFGSVAVLGGVALGFVAWRVLKAKPTA